MHDNLHTDPALDRVAADQRLEERRQRRLDVMDGLSLAEGTASREAVRTVGRRASKGVIVVGTAGALLTPTMTGVAAATTPGAEPDIIPTEQGTEQGTEPAEEPTDQGTEQVTEQGTEPAEESVAEPVTLDVAPEVVADVIPDVIPDVAPEVVADVIPDVAPDVAPEVVADVVAEIVPEVVAESAPVVAPAQPPVPVAAAPVAPPVPSMPAPPRPTPPRPATPTAPIVVVPAHVVAPPVPGPIAAPAPVVPPRIDPTTSPQPVTAGGPGLVASAGSGQAVHPALSPNLTTAQTNAESAPAPAPTLDDRIKRAQQRPVNEARVGDWSRAVLDAWTRMQADPNAGTQSVVTSDDVAATPTLGWSYEVQPGDSLWTISQQLWGVDTLTSSQVQATWQLIYTWNADRLGANPDAIPTGVVIQIPIDASA